ncbi:MAG: hypothetical protein WD509_03180 [Candidatus Paceibacterota bacterium]
MRIESPEGQSPAQVAKTGDMLQRIGSQSPKLSEVLRTQDE